MKTQRITVNMQYVSCTSWVLNIENTHYRFGVLFETADSFGYSEHPDLEYRYSVAAYVVAHVPHRSLCEPESTDRQSMIFDAFQYAGGVPIDHLVWQDTDTIAALFTARQAKIKKTKSLYGTYAAQYGVGSEVSVFSLSDAEQADRFVQYGIKRLPTIVTDIGAILDRPVNLVGDSGWSVIKTLIFGHGRNQ